MRKKFALLLTLVLAFTASNQAFAYDESKTEENDIVLELNVDEIDFSQPYNEVYEFLDDEGKVYSVEMNYTPAIKARASGSTVQTAVDGVCTAIVRYGSGLTLQEMSFKFDITSKVISSSSSSWKETTISNARSLAYQAPFTTFSNSSLSIARSKCTTSFPAEVNASITAKIFDNSWINALYTTTWSMSVTINSVGTMTLSWSGF